MGLAKDAMVAMGRYVDDMFGCDRPIEHHGGVMTQLLTLLIGTLCDKSKAVQSMTNMLILGAEILTNAARRVAARVAPRKSNSGQNAL